jgi:hypothetical protein
MYDDEFPIWWERKWYMNIGVGSTWKDGEVVEVWGGMMR